MCLLSNYCLWLIVVHFLWKINAFSCREILPDLLSSSPQRKESGVGRLFDPNMTFLIVTTNSILFQRGNSKKSMFLMSFWFSDLSDLTYERLILVSLKVSRIRGLVPEQLTSGGFIFDDFIKKSPKGHH